MKLRRAGDLSRTKKRGGTTCLAGNSAACMYVCVPACQKGLLPSPSPHAEVSSRGSFVLCLQDYGGASTVPIITCTTFTVHTNHHLYGIYRTHQKCRSAKRWSPLAQSYHHAAKELHVPRAGKRLPNAVPYYSSRSSSK